MYAISLDNASNQHLIRRCCTRASQDNDTVWERAGLARPLCLVRVGRVENQSRCRPAQSRVSGRCSVPLDCNAIRQNALALRSRVEIEKRQPRARARSAAQARQALFPRDSGQSIGIVQATCAGWLSSAGLCKTAVQHTYERHTNHPGKACAYKGTALHIKNANFSTALPLASRRKAKTAVRSKY